MTAPDSGNPKIPPRVNIRVVREAHGLTIRDLMARMEECGVTVSDPAVIRAIETGNSRPSEKMTKAIAQALGLHRLDIILPPSNGNGTA